jgi:predicted hydrolase (HD superfamily)
VKKHNDRIEEQKMEHIARDEAFVLLKKYNKDPFHIQHALTVEAVMKW